MTLKKKIEVINEIYIKNKPEHLIVINELVRRLTAAEKFILTNEELEEAMKACDLEYENV